MVGVGKDKERQVEVCNIRVLVALSWWRHTACSLVVNKKVGDC